MRPCRWEEASSDNHMLPSPYPILIPHFHIPTCSLRAFIRKTREMMSITAGVPSYGVLS